MCMSLVIRRSRSVSQLYLQGLFFFQPPIVLLRKYEIRVSQICASRDCAAPPPQPLSSSAPMLQSYPRYGHVNVAAMIDAPAKCELRSIIRFLQAEGHSAAEIHCRMSKVYGENFMSDGSVWEWCRKFKEGRTDVHDEGGHGRKSVATVGLVERVDQRQAKVYNQ